MSVSYNFSETETQVNVKAMVRDFAEKHIRPNIMEWDEAQHFPIEIFKQLGELGLMGVLVPEIYGGSGFGGGMWAGNVYRYNTAVNNVNTTVIRNTYVNNTVINNNNTTVNNRTSFNGRGGVAARPSGQEQMAMREQHINPTAQQSTHQEAARQDRNQLASVNNGRPATVAMNKVNGNRFDQQGRNANNMAAGGRQMSSAGVAGTQNRQQNMNRNNQANTPVNGNRGMTQSNRQSGQHQSAPNQQQQRMANQQQHMQNQQQHMQNQQQHMPNQQQRMPNQHQPQQPQQQQHAPNRGGGEHERRG